MKRKIILAALPLLGIIGTLLLSSFFRPIKSSGDAPEPCPAPDVKYRSMANKTGKKGHLRMSTAFQNDYFTDNNNEGHFYVELKADQFNNAHYERPAMNLSIVIDRSGSMSGAKLQNAKKAAKHIVDNLSSGDYLSIVVYDQDVSTLHHQASVRDKAGIKRKIDGIRQRGSTNLMGGAMRGYDEVNKYYRSGYINRVLLLSDGLANEGITDPNRINRIVQGKFRENNIAISTFGIGNNYNEDLMTAMAEKGNGNYYFISKPNEIAGIFRKELNGLMEVMAQNTMLNITVPNNVKVKEVYGYSHTQRGNQVSIKLNDIFSKETKGILIRYHINRANMPNRISFRSRLTFRNASSERNEYIALRNYQNYTNRHTVYEEHFSEWVDVQVILNRTNYKMEQAMKAIDKGDYARGRRLVKETKDMIKAKPMLVKKSKELRRAQTANATYDNEIVNIETRSESEKKYIQKSNKSMNYQIRRKK